MFFTTLSSGSSAPRAAPTLAQYSEGVPVVLLDGFGPVSGTAGGLAGALSELAPKCQLGSDGSIVQLLTGTPIR